MITNTDVDSDCGSKELAADAVVDTVAMGNGRTRSASRWQDVSFSRLDEGVVTMRANIDVDCDGRAEEPGGNVRMDGGATCVRHTSGLSTH